MTIKEITELRKAGRLEEALHGAEAEYATNQNVYTAGALFWCLNDLQKQQNRAEASDTLRRMKALCDVDPELRQFIGWNIYQVLKLTPADDANARKTLLNEYLQINPEAPSLLHSLMLSEAVKVEQNTPMQFRFRDFVRLWGPDNLRDEDWEQFKTEDGNVLPSLVEKVIGVYVKELKTGRVTPPDSIVALVDKALKVYPNSQNMPYFKATLLLSEGKKEEAIGYYRQLIMRYPTKYYLWYQLSGLIEDPDTRIGLLSKALSLRVDENFLGKVRLSMARLLIDKGHLPQARYELDRYRDFYQANNWGLKREYWDLHNRVPDVPSSESNRPLYVHYAPKADDFIYAGLPQQYAVKVSEQHITDRNRPSRKILLWTLMTEQGTMRVKQPSRYGLNRQAPNGAALVIKVSNGNVVWAHHTRELPTLGWIREVKGVVKIRTARNDRRYAIIDDAFIADHLLEGVPDGCRVTARAVRGEDGRWSAVSLIRL